VSGQLHASAALPPRKKTPGTHSTGDWVDPRAGLDAVEKTLLSLPRIEPRLLDSPARSPVAIGFKALTLNDQILMSIRATLLCCVLCRIVLEAEGSKMRALLVTCLLAVRLNMPQPEILDLNPKVHHRQYILMYVTEQVGLAVMRHTRIRKMLGLNLWRNTGYHD
jgi:hypothetical protein